MRGSHVSAGAVSLYQPSMKHGPPGPSSQKEMAGFRVQSYHHDKKYNSCKNSGSQHVHERSALGSGSWYRLSVLADNIAANDV